jgi:hypothetical protein
MDPRDIGICVFLRTWGVDLPETVGEDSIENILDYDFSLLEDKTDVPIYSDTFTTVEDLGRDHRTDLPI